MTRSSSIIKIDKLIDFRNGFENDFPRHELEELKRFAELGLCEIFYNDKAQISGYLLVAEINKYTAKNLIKNRIIPLYDYEFTEGKIGLVKGAFLSPNSIGHNKLKRYLLKFRRVYYFKRGNQLKVAYRIKNSQIKLILIK